MPIRTTPHILLAALAATLLSICTPSQARFLGVGPAVTTRNITLSYNAAYDNGSTPLSTVACSDGSNGLMTMGYTTFSSLPSFPYVGGADVVEGYNSNRCGECWRLTYADADNATSLELVGKVHVLLVDGVVEKGWTVARRAMDDLTDGRAEKLGRVDAVAKARSV